MTTLERRSNAVGPAKTARLEARVTEEQKTLFMRAASLQGRTLTEFLVNSVLEVATKTVRDHEIMTLTGQDRQAFVESLLKPPAPGKRLRQAAKRYKKKTER
jgi:uncharacterized protein (DUF1778 family)